METTASQQVKTTCSNNLLRKVKISHSDGPCVCVCGCACTGAVLVFLPGLAEIKQLYEQLQSNRMFNNRRKNR